MPAGGLLTRALVLCFAANLFQGRPLFGWVLAQAGWPAMFRSAGALVVAGGVLFYVWDARPSAGPVGR